MSAVFPGIFGTYVPTYPGPPGLESSLQFQYGPTFDGLYANNTTTDPYLNSLFQDVNMMDSQIMASTGGGYAPLPQTQYPSFQPPYPPPTTQEQIPPTQEQIPPPQEQTPPPVAPTGPPTGPSGQPTLAQALQDMDQYGNTWLDYSADGASGLAGLDGLEAIISAGNSGTLTVDTTDLQNSSGANAESLYVDASVILNAETGGDNNTADGQLLQTFNSLAVSGTYGPDWNLVGQNDPIAVALGGGASPSGPAGNVGPSGANPAGAQTSLASALQDMTQYEYTWMDNSADGASGMGGLDGLESIVSAYNSGTLTVDSTDLQNSSGANAQSLYEDASVILNAVLGGDTNSADQPMIQKFESLAVSGTYGPDWALQPGSQTSDPLFQALNTNG